MNLINFNELEKLYEDNADFQQEIVANFIKRIPINFDCLRDSLVQKNSEELQNYSCQLRAVSRRCCVDELHHLCVVLEQQAKQKEFAPATRTFLKIQDIFYHIQNEYPSSMLH